MAESVFCLQWDVALQAVILHEKRWDIKIHDQLIMVMIKSASMNRVNVLVRFNQLLQYCCSFPHIQYGHPRSHLPSQRLENTYFFISSAFSPLSCNDNNYMTYNWLNSSFFNFQENVNQENCRQYSSIIFLYIYIHTRFQKGFHRERYMDRYIYFCSFARAPVCIFHLLLSNLWKTRFNDKFFRRRVFCSNLTCRFEFFF